MSFYKLKIYSDTPPDQSMRAIIALLDVMRITISQDLFDQLPNDVKPLFQEVEP